MKIENADAAEKSENQSDKQASAKLSKARLKPSKVPRAKKEVDGVRLPVLVEFTYTISVLLLLFLGLTVIVISFISGASLLNLVLRTGVAIVVMGALLMLISSQISSGVLNASMVEQEELNKKQSDESQDSANIENHSTVEA